MKDLPAVSFVILADNDAEKLIGCLETIVRQEYPETLVETVVMDWVGGSETAEVARRFSAEIVRCDQEDAAARINLGISRTRGDFVFAIGADSGLSRTDWLRMMIRPFMERPEVAAAITQTVEMPNDSAFARYLCRLSGNPFEWFVHGDAANPRSCRSMYGVSGTGDGYTIHHFPARHPPMISPDHGVGLRRSALEGLPSGNEEITPLIRLIESGQPVAVVPGAGIHHPSVDSLWLFLKESYVQLRNGSDGWPVCSEQHSAHRSLWRRTRKYLFELYGLTVVMPVLDGVWLSVIEQNAFMLLHGPAAIALSWLILVERIRRNVGGRSVPGDIRNSQ